MSKYDIVNREKTLNLMNSTNSRDVDIIEFLAYQLVVRVHYKMNCV